jgi:hypothetical protein
MPSSGEDRCLRHASDRGIAQMDFCRHMAPELWLAAFMACMSGALVAAYMLSR